MRGSRCHHLAAAGTQVAGRLEKGRIMAHKCERTKVVCTPYRYYDKGPEDSVEHTPGIRISFTK